MIYRGGPLDLRFGGPLEAKTFVRAPKIDPPGAPGRVFGLECRSCGQDLGWFYRCVRNSQRVPEVFLGPSVFWRPGVHRPSCWSTQRCASGPSLKKRSLVVSARRFFSGWYRRRSKAHEWTNPGPRNDFRIGVRGYISAEQSHNLKVSDRRRNT
jgi:hypothetical protein